jgi:hypothetical protein
MLSHSAQITQKISNFANFKKNPFFLKKTFFLLKKLKGNLKPTQSQCKINIQVLESNDHKTSYNLQYKKNMFFEESEPGEPRHWGTTVAIIALVCN